MAERDDAFEDTVRIYDVQELGRFRSRFPNLRQGLIDRCIRLDRGD